MPCHLLGLLTTEPLETNFSGIWIKIPSKNWCFQWQIKLMVACTFLCLFFIHFFLELIVTYTVSVLYVWENNNSNEWVMITWLMWITWTLLSAVQESFTTSLAHSLTDSLSMVSNRYGAPKSMHISHLNPCRFLTISMQISHLNQGSHTQALKKFNDFSMIFQDKIPKFPW